MYWYKYRNLMVVFQGIFWKKIPGLHRKEAPPALHLRTRHPYIYALMWLDTSMRYWYPSKDFFFILTSLYILIIYRAHLKLRINNKENWIIWRDKHTVLTYNDKSYCSIWGKPRKSKDEKYSIKEMDTQLSTESISWKEF